MTINKLPNQDDVQHGSGIRGVDEHFLASAPRGFSAASSGGATVEDTRYGRYIGGSNTAGNTANQRGFHGAAAGEFSKDVLTLDMWVLDAPFTDDVEIGMMQQGGINQDKGAYLDLTAEEYHVGANTAPATIPGSFSSLSLTIEMDHEANETAFSLSGAVGEEVTISEKDVGRNRFMYYNSNGNGERSPAVIRYKRRLVP